MEDDLNFSQMEDKLNFSKMEDINGRWPLLFGKWKKTSIIWLRHNFNMRQSILWNNYSRGMWRLWKCCYWKVVTTKLRLRMEQLPWTLPQHTRSKQLSKYNQIHFKGTFFLYYFRNLLMEFGKKENIWINYVVKILTYQHVMELTCEPSHSCPIWCEICPHDN